jgi:hypothetical protein
MSKMQEEKNEKQTGKNFPSMSSRQQILYLMNKTQNENNWNPDEKASEVEVMDYQKYFFEKKEKKVIHSLTKIHNKLEKFPS